jgi:hypothetical protein
MIQDREEDTGEIPTAAIDLKDELRDLIDTAQTNQNETIEKLYQALQRLVEQAQAQAVQPLSQSLTTLEQELATQTKLREAAQAKVAELLRPGGVDAHVASLKDDLRKTKRALRKAQDAEREANRLYQEMGVTSSYLAGEKYRSQVHRLREQAKRIEKVYTKERLTETKLSAAFAERDAALLELEEFKLLRPRLPLP